MISDMYYRIFQSYTDGKLTVICMQWFDEHDYDKDRFMTDENGDRLMFDTESEAVEWLNQNVKPNYIDQDYLKVGFNRDEFLL